MKMNAEIRLLVGEPKSVKLSKLGMTNASLFHKMKENANSEGLLKKNGKYFYNSEIVTPILVESRWQAVPFSGLSLFSFYFRSGFIFDWRCR